MTEIEKLTRNLKSISPKQKQQTLWVKCKSVDWDNKTMNVEGIEDELEIFDVLLGLEYYFLKPVINTICLIGIIENEETQCFLISANSVELIEISDKTGFKIILNNGNLTINGDSFSGIVKAPELKTQVDKNTALLEKMKTVFSQWTVVPQDGGQALKTLSAQFTSMETADLSNIENKKIKHGG